MNQLADAFFQTRYERKMPMNRPWILATGILALGMAAAGTAEEKRLDTFGTTSFSYLRVGFSSFSPLDSSMTYSDLNFSRSVFSRFPTNANGSGKFVAVPSLPSGALVSAVEFDWCDTSAASDLQFDVFSSGYTGETIQGLGSGSSDGSLGCSFTVVALDTPFTVNNDGTQLILQATLPTHDGTTSISGGVVRYVLQVSSPPATPSFNDVPTNDQGYQYIQALLASGITGGCGSHPPFSPPVYCPDSFVTRRQMAIFLAKALGLQWP